MKQTEKSEISDVVDFILSDYDDESTVNKIDIYNHPDKSAIVYIVEKIFKILLRWKYHFVMIVVLVEDTNVKELYIIQDKSSEEKSLNNYIERCRAQRFPSLFVRATSFYAILNLIGFIPLNTHIYIYTLLFT